MSEATAAVYLSAEDGGESFLLADSAELETDTLMISPADDPQSLFMVDRAAFLRDHRVTVDRPPETGTGKRRRFSLRGRGR